MFENTIEDKKQKGYFHGQRPEMLKYIPDNAIRILEVGCGEGTFCAAMKRNDREIWGIEMNKEAALKAGNECYKVLHGDFDSVFAQLPTHYFDCVVFNDVLEHLIAPWDTIQQVKLLLNSDGVLVSSIPNFRSFSNLITEILWLRDFRYKPEGGILDDTHLRFFTSKSICRMHQEQGYEILAHEGIRATKRWKEKICIALALGFLNDTRYKQFATLAKPLKE